MRSPAKGRIRSVPIKLTADSGAQVTACNVDKLQRLGLRRKDLLSTAVGLECANKEDANVLGVFIGKVIAKDDNDNAITAQSLVYVMKHGGDLLSKEVLRQLGVLPPEFPNIGQDRLQKTKWIGLVLGMKVISRQCFCHEVSVILKILLHASAQ